MVISTLEALILTILTFCYGYVVLFASFKRAKKAKFFFNMDSFDKSMQSLLVGFVLLSVSMLTLNIQEFSIETILSNVYSILLIELFYASYSMIIISDNIKLLIA